MDASFHSNSSPQRRRLFILIICLAALTSLALLNSLGKYLLKPTIKRETYLNDYTSDQLRPYLEAEKWELYSLDPSDRKPIKKGASGQEGQAQLPPEREFHGYLILGEAISDDRSKLQSVIHALDLAGQNWNGARAGCFNPRHGIRVRHKGETHDLVICYECAAAVLYQNNQSKGCIKMGTRPEFKPDSNVLNALLPKHAEQESEP